jgi:hypothetical protein
MKDMAAGKAAKAAEQANIDRYTKSMADLQILIDEQNLTLDDVKRSKEQGQRALALAENLADGSPESIQKVVDGAQAVIDEF